MAKKYKKMQDGGSTISDADRSMIQSIIDRISGDMDPGIEASAKKAADRFKAARLAKMARVKPPRMRGDSGMAGDVTTGIGRSREIMEQIARGGAQNMKYGGKVEKMMGGGKVDYMMDGGEAGGSCRGGGAAMRGTKFRGVK